MADFKSEKGKEKEICDDSSNKFYGKRDFDIDVLSVTYRIEKSTAINVKRRRL